MPFGAVAAAIGGAVGSDIAGTIITGALVGGAVSGVTGGNILQGALLGGATAGIGSAVSGAVSGAAGAGAGAGSGLAAGGTMTADQIQAAMDAYTSAGYTADQAAGFIGQAAGVQGMTASTLNGIVNGGGTLNMASQASQLGSIASSGLGNTLSSALKSGTSTPGFVQSATGALANLGQGVLQSNAISNAAAAEAQAAANANQQQLAMYNENVALQAPWRAAGTTALGQLSAGTQQGGQFNTPFTMAMAQNMPAYQFAEQQGQGAIDANAARGGTRLSSANLENLAQFNAGNAAQYENQAFNQYMTQNNAAANQLQSLAGLGQTAVTNTQTAGQNTVNNTSANTMAVGSTNAGAALGQGNVTANTIGNIANSGIAQYTLSGLLNSAT